MFENMHKKEVTISFDTVELKANLVIPEEAKGIIIFSHGSGSSRFSSRNNYVANVLNDRNIATLLADLLSPVEDNVYETRFNISLLTERLVKITEWVGQNDKLKNLPVGYFGASTGAASALRTAVKMTNIKTV